MAKGKTRGKKIALEDVDDYLAVNDPIILETQPERVNKISIGKKVHVTMPTFSKHLRAKQKIDFSEGKVKKNGNIKLDSGEELEPGITYTLELTRELKLMLLKGVLKGGGKPFLINDLRKGVSK